VVVTTLLTVQTALLALARNYNSGATFDSTNSSILDWTVLDAQDTEVSAVVVMEGPSQEDDEINGFGRHGHFQELHRVGLWVYVKKGTGEGGEAAAATACQTLTEALKDYIRPYEQLSHGAPIKRAKIGTTTQPAVYGAGQSHVGQEIVFSIQCDSESVVTESGY
jgi:hypothetical protein